MCELMKSSSHALDATLGFMQYLEHLQFLKVSAENKKFGHLGDYFCRLFPDKSVNLAFFVQDFGKNIYHCCQLSEFHSYAIS